MSSYICLYNYLIFYSLTLLKCSTTQKGFGDYDFPVSLFSFPTELCISKRRMVPKFPIGQVISPVRALLFVFRLTCIVSNLVTVVKDHQLVLCVYAHMICLTNYRPHNFSVCQHLASF